MYQRDWLDELRWGAILLGVLVALLLQVALTLLVLRPLEFSVGWPAVILVEFCIALGAFVSGWRARHAVVVNSTIAALISAVISLTATAIRTPAQLNVLSIVFLFGSFALMGALGGLAAGQVRARSS